MPDQVDWRAIEREATPGRAVGRLLRDQREARGLTLVDVEKSLRIRRSHLEAIEEGRFDKLPGAAYIPAFLRAYAAHVDLDAEKVMTAYHLSGPVPIKRPVSLPADFPIVEKRAPIGLAVLTVLLVVGVGYGVWHYLPREQAVVAEKVPPVPDRLLAARPGPLTPGTSTSGTQVGDAPAVSAPGNLPAEVWPAQRTGAAASSTTTGTTVVTPPAVSNAPTANAPTTNAGVPSMTQPAALAPPPVVVAVPAPPPPVVMSVPAIGQAQAAQPPAFLDAARIPLQAAPTVAEEATARQPAPEAAPVALPAIPVRVDTPVSVRTNSWVELRGANGEVLAQTYVRAGESYTVPAGIAYRVIEAR